MSQANTPDDDEAREVRDVAADPAQAGEPADQRAPAPSDGPFAEAAEPAEMPFTERYRLPVGLVAAAACVVVAVFFAVVGPASAVEPGAFGLILRWATPVLWGLLAVVAITWAVRMPKRLTNGLASVVLLAYLAYLIVRSV